PRWMAPGGLFAAMNVLTGRPPPTLSAIAIMSAGTLTRRHVKHPTRAGNATGRMRRGEHPRVRPARVCQRRDGKQLQHGGTRNGSRPSRPPFESPLSSPFPFLSDPEAWNAF